MKRGNELSIFLLVVADSEDIDIEDIDIMAFDTVGHALGYMEYPEIEARVVDLYDGRGRHANVFVENWQPVLRGWSSQPDETRLRRQIKRYLTATSQTFPIDPESLSIEALIRQLGEMIRPKRSRRRFFRRLRGC